MIEISDEMYEELRLILEKKNEKAYMLEEVREIGDALVEFLYLTN